MKEGDLRTLYHNISCNNGQFYEISATRALSKYLGPPQNQHLHNRNPGTTFAPCAVPGLHPNVGKSTRYLYRNTVYEQISVGIDGFGFAGQ